MGDNTPFRSLDLIEPGDLVHYHGSIKTAHGFYLAVPCPCSVCRLRHDLSPTDTRYLLTDPWGDLPGPQCVRRASITRSTACN
ncbi:hypothetical protein [Streptomyces sp. AV19]|uniref:hypothetical protein n=1 Tax=Streptomyces sp. AV19 TaxID=2793068 RepID=UPI00241395BB|nr:hypothetical protein [Streptomyces sp. AV19]MDG4535298.1 hypothetical protein [Streptomyces sp. AV19]